MLEKDSLDDMRLTSFESLCMVVTENNILHSNIASLNSQIASLKKCLLCCEVLLSEEEDSAERVVNMIRSELSKYGTDLATN